RRRTRTYGIDGGIRGTCRHAPWRAPPGGLSGGAAVRLPAGCCVRLAWRRDLGASRRGGCGCSAGQPGFCEGLEGGRTFLRYAPAVRRMAAPVGAREPALKTARGAPKGEPFDDPLVILPLRSAGMRRIRSFPLPFAKSAFIVPMSMCSPRRRPPFGDVKR